MIPFQTRRTATDSAEPKWFHSPVTIHGGTLTDIRKYIPAFERRGFALTQPGNEQSRLNERLDTIVRQPFGADQTFIPVGVVSKDYALVPHTTVLDFAAQALDGAGIASADVRAELKITEYGERMALNLSLPDKFSFDPGDGHLLALRLECINSVEGSTRFRVVVSWHRLVCRNGMIVGVTSGVRRRHIGELGLGDISEILKKGLAEAQQDAARLRLWRRKAVSDELAPWIDSTMQKAWGFKAAVRTWHIARTGADVEILGQYKNRTPTTIAVQKTMPVPGAPKESQTLYDVSQILAWLAKDRRDVQEQLAWREQIPALLEPLMSA